MDERPLPDPVKLHDRLAAYQTGESTAGRAMADLKTGRLPEWLAATGDDRATAMLEAWDGWERGRTGPAEVLTVLVEGGLPDLLAGTPA
jgi:hypothetical protein